MRTIIVVLALVGAAAEQRSLLRRAGRASEATPLITLPDSLLFPNNDAEQHGAAGSLLLQKTDGEQHSGKDDEAHGITYSDAVKEIQASRSGYGTQLMNAVQESANEVVEDAREAFFASTAAPTTAAATTAAATTTAATTTVAVTTTTAMTTVDPAILARQLKLTKDQAEARNMLVGMISRAQMGLLSRLNDISLDLEATEQRAKMDLKAVNHSASAAANMPIMVSNAEVDVKKIDTNGDKLEASIPVILGRASNNTNLIGELMSEKEALEKDVKKSSKLAGAKRRVQNNAQTLGAVIPRLEQLEGRVTKLEMRLYDGDINKLVDDTTNKEVINVMEDVSRGFGRFIANKAA